jgi:hypothetical protein
MCGAVGHVRFTPNSDRESEIPQKAMSALPRKRTLELSVKQTLNGAIYGLCLAQAGFLVPKDPARMIKTIKAAIEKITPAGEDPFWSWVSIVALSLFVANVFWFR